MKKRFEILITLLIIQFLAQGQMIDFAEPVSFNYRGETLEQVLADIETNYGIVFSYSRDMIPLDQKIYANIEHTACGKALDSLFEQTQVTFGVVGIQVVLGIDTQKVAVLPDHGFFDPASLDDAWASRGRLMGNVGRRQSSPIPRLSAPPMTRPSRDSCKRHMIEMEPGDMTKRPHSSIFDRYERRENSPVAHFSLVYPIGYRTPEDDPGPTNIGLHLTWGHERAANGVILAGLGSTVEGKMEGIQLSGLFNAVGEDIEGAQFSGIVNLNIAETRGASFSGIMNYSASLTGVQMAGMLNVTPGPATGFQGAGLGNIAADGWGISQAAGLFNIGLGTGDIQVAGLFNIGDRIRVGQVGGLLNVAKKVDGFQIGLINIADTVSGPTIGLLNLVKKGYHSFELSGQEGIHANAMLRLGTKPFYNIFRAGMRVDEMTWAIGYGIGTSIPWGRRNGLQIELMCSHVNEGTLWSDRLNLLNQLNLLANIKFGRHFGLALGPVFNVSVSKAYHPESDLYGMNLGSNYLFNETAYSSGGKPVNVRGWIGFHAGLRLESR